MGKNGSRIVGVICVVFSAIALVVSLSGSSQVNGEIKWTGPPNFKVTSNLDYIRVDGLDFRLGDNASKIRVVGLGGRWSQILIEDMDGKGEVLTIHMDNIQAFTPSPRKYGEEGADNSPDNSVD